jgi:hypothetical protein
LPAPASGRAYELTERGRELEPVLHALGRWGSRQAFGTVTHEMTVDAFAVALATVFEPSLASGMDATVALVVDGDALVAEVYEDTFEIRRGVADRPEARLEGSVATLRELLWRGRRLEELEAEGVLVVGGLRSVVRRFLKLFPPTLTRTSN